MAMLLKRASAVSVSVKRTSGVAPRPVLRPPTQSRNVLVRSSEPEVSEAQAKLQKQVDEALAFVKGKWEKTEDNEKPAAIAIIIGVVVAQIAIGATVDAVDRIPIVNKLLQLVGVSVTTLFFYRYFTDPAEREGVKKSIDGFVKSVTGEK